MRSIKLLAIMILMNLSVISCVVSNTPQGTPRVPSETRVASTNTPKWTSTSRPTIPPRPTYTSTPLPGWIVNFTEPILKQIADRPPTYEDDFSDPSSGWHNGPVTGKGNVLFLGEKRYDHGEYSMVAEDATAANPVVCSYIEDRNVGRYMNFVLEFDVRFVSDTDGDWQLQFLISKSGLHKIQLGRHGPIGFGKCGFKPGDCSDLGASFANAVHGGNAWNHIQLIVQDTKMAAYVNGVPSLYAEDATVTDEPMRGYFSINSCNSGPTPLETRWDNFRLWDISDLS